MNSDSDSASTKKVNTRARQRVRKMEGGDDKITTLPHRHSIRSPPFWPEKPNIWFRQVEGQFELFGITDDEAKFYHVLASLERQYAAEVEDIITGPPDYKRLKSELIKRLSASRENEVKQLLTQEQIGTRRPSQFLRHLQHLAGPDVPADFVRTIWVSRLPTSLQPIVASQSTLPLDAIAELADRVHDIAVPAHQVAATSASPSSSAARSPIDELAHQVAELTRQVSALTAQAQRRSRTSDRRERRPRSRSTSRRSQSNYRRYPTCWYHSRHGSKARRCIKPCDYNPGNATGSQ